MRLRHAVVSFAMAAGIAGWATEPVAGGASFEIRSHSAVAHLGDRETAFTLEFTDKPDFFAGGDDVGTERHAFQYFLDVEPLLGEDPFAGPDIAVVRGPEIRFDPAGLLRVRASQGPDDGDPANGGWGPLLAAVPLELDHRTVRFTIPWDLIGETDGAMSYVVEAYEDGGLTSSFASAGPGVVLPLPPGAWTGLIVVFGIVIGQTLYARRRARRANHGHGRWVAH